MRSPRISFAGGYYHVTTRCNNKEFLFKDDQDFELYCKFIAKGKQKHGVKLYAYNLMHNHVHLLVHTPEKGNLSQFMHYVNGEFAKAYNRLHGRQGHFWGERFYSTVFEVDSQYAKTTAYIELNAVKAKMVKSPRDWKWSSYLAHAFGKYDSILDKHTSYLNVSDDDAVQQKHHRQMIQHYMEENGLQFCPPISKGIIAGTKDFVNNLLEKIQNVHVFYKKRKAFHYSGDCFCLKRL